METIVEKMFIPCRVLFSSFNDKEKIGKLQIYVFSRLCLVDMFEKKRLIPKGHKYV